MIIGKKIIHYKEIDSTNDQAKRLIKKGFGEGTVIVADSQSKGRGKPGSSWFSPPKDGIYLSAVVKPYKNPKDLAPITLLGAKAVVNSIEKTSPLKAKIKLPNDVIVNDKKICGVLVERVASGHLIIGIGVNINNPVGSFPEEIKDSASSLKIESKKNIEPQKFVGVLVSELDQEYLAYLGKI
jgi:BirA family biotin operon repressor/biotin-[acetyl-CoA-carboxylase] ligase